MDPVRSVDERLGQETGRLQQEQHARSRHQKGVPHLPNVIALCTALNGAQTILRPNSLVGVNDSEDARLSSITYDYSINNLSEIIVLYNYLMYIYYFTEIPFTRAQPMSI